MDDDELHPASFFRFFDYTHIDGFTTGRTRRTRKAGWYLFDRNHTVVAGPIRDFGEFVKIARVAWIKALVAGNTDMQGLGVTDEELRAAISKGLEEGE